MGGQRSGGGAVSGKTSVNSRRPLILDVLPLKRVRYVRLSVRLTASERWQEADRRETSTAMRPRTTVVCASALCDGDLLSLQSQVCSSLPNRGMLWSSIR
jgi:hypothetical protein